MPASPRELLERWLAGRLRPEARAWLAERLQKIADADNDRDLYLAISLVPRKLGKADLALDAGELAEAEEARAGWDPGDWSVDQAARALFILAGCGEGDALDARLKYLFSTADVAEHISFLKALPLLPDAARHEMRAREGARSNMRPVFEAIAHRNPYPAEQFAENAWNHMVLKALFIGSTLHPVQGLDRRANAELATMLHHTAQERHAAGRKVTPEMWRCVGPFADEAAVADLARILVEGDDNEKSGAALALAACPLPSAKAALQDKGGSLRAAVESGELTWDSLSARLTA